MCIRFTKRAKTIFLCFGIERTQVYSAHSTYYFSVGHFVHSDRLISYMHPLRVVQLLASSNLSLNLIVLLLEFPRKIPDRNLFLTRLHCFNLLLDSVVMIDSFVEVQIEGETG